MDDSSRVLIAQALGWIAVIAVVVWVIQAATRTATKTAIDEREKHPSKSETVSPNGYYVVVGVDRTTKEDKNIRVKATTPGNAQVKAELDGIIVTSVRPAHSEDL